MDWALYDPDDGFYGRGGGAGRRGGDFITSPEVGPLFGRLVARYLDQLWEALGEPEPFVVAEAAAGTGTLARTIVAAEPACQTALRYHLVEVAASSRADQMTLVDAYPNIFVSSCEWPRHCHVGLANELLDNLPTRVVDTSDAPIELYARATDDGWSSAWEPVAETLPNQVLAAGAIVPWAQEAHRWVEHARATSEVLVVFDYGASTAELATRGREGWLRCYRDHHRFTDPFMDPGAVDITVDVPIDQLPTPTRAERQADWLAARGLDALVEAAALQWRQQAHIGDLSAVRARSTVNEAAALTDPDGLGSFWVLTWSR